jgi:hypothetical protein
MYVVGFAPQIILAMEFLHWCMVYLDDLHQQRTYTSPKLTQRIMHRCKNTIARMLAVQKQTTYIHESQMNTDVHAPA